MKLEKVCEAFDNLGLKLSPTKTELQHNQWVVPSKVGQSLEYTTWRFHKKN